MNFQFYQLKCEKNKIPKKFGTDYVSVGKKDDVVFLEPTSFTHPSLRVTLDLVSITDGAITKEKVYHCNYLLSIDTGRYYFVDDIIAEKSNVFRLNCTVDVLSTFSESILNQTAMISRSESDSTEGYPYFHADSRMPLYSALDPPVHINSEEPMFNYYGSDDDGYFWLCFTAFGTISHNVGIYPMCCQPYYGASITYLCKSKKYSTDKVPLYQWLMSYILKDTTYSSFVSSVFIIPFDCTKYVTYGDTLLKCNTVIIGENSLDVSDWDVYYINPVVLTEGKLVATATNYRELPPYTNYFVELPLVGMIELDANDYFDITNNLLIIKYQMLMDFTVGCCTYKLLNFKNEIKYTVSIECCCPVPISTSNAADIARQKEGYNIGGMGSILNGLFSGFNAGVKSTAMTGDVYTGAALGLLTSLVNTLSVGFDYGSKTETLVAKGTVGTASSMFNSLDVVHEQVATNNYITLIVVTQSTMYLPNSYGEDYYHLNGHTCMKTGVLKNLSGYTEISSVHLDNIYCAVGTTIGYATSEELDMIEEILKTGFIIEQ